MAKVLIKDWNLNLAEVEYRLIEHYDSGEEKLLARGDYEWAVRTAEHFNLDHPGILL